MSKTGITSMKPWLISIERLKAVLSARPDLLSALETSIQAADLEGIKSLAEFYELLLRMLTDIPKRREMNDDLGYLHLIISSSPDNILENDETFVQWLSIFAKDHGSFLDTTESAKELETFIKDPSFHVEEY